MPDNKKKDQPGADPNNGNGNPPAGDPPPKDPPGNPGDGSGNEPGKTPPEIDSKVADKWDPETRKYIEGLRSESARYRTSAKTSKDRISNIENDLGNFKKKIGQALGFETDEDPEEKAAQLADHNQQLQFESACKDLAIDNGISGRDQSDYFQFLMAKAAEDLGENEEIDEETIDELVTKTKQAFGNKSQSTTVGNKATDGKNGKPAGNGEPPPAKGNGDVSVQEFARMTITEKSKLYGDTPDVYKKLFADAKQQHLL